jgi:hypothetical protein
MTHKHWKEMPSFIQEKSTSFKCIDLCIGGRKLKLRFDNNKDFDGLISKGGSFTDNTLYVKTLEEAMDLLGQKITDKTKSLWYPFKSHWGGIKHKWVSNSKLPLKYPVYVVSKGRSNRCITSRELSNMEVPHYVVVEEHEYIEYLDYKQPLATLLTLPSKYLEQYDTCDDLGFSKSVGPGAARNFCIDHSRGNYFSKHWVMDDNIETFDRLHENEKLKVTCGNGFRAVEDFVDRYSNVPLAGLNYSSFCKSTDKANPFILNTRVYSCILMNSDGMFKWRGRYNEDTDLSLRVLKSGLCTIQINAFLAGKVTTQRMRGGNSQEFYDKEGTLPKSKMLEQLHPDVAKVVWKFNRWHHQVNYKPFKNNRLVLKGDVELKPTANEYGLIKIDK